MTDTPAHNPEPAPGGPAAAATIAPSVVAAESSPTAPSPASKLDPAAVIAAFLGDVEPPAQGDTKDAKPADSETEEEEQEQEQQDAGTKTPVDHLLDRLRQNPDDPKLIARLRRLASEPAELKRINAELETKIKASAIPAVNVPATYTDPLASVSTQAQLHEVLRNAEAWEAWCEDNPEGGELHEGKEETYLSPEQVKSNLRFARAQLRAAPARTEWLRTLDATRQALLDEVPELFEKDSPLYKEAVGLIQDGRVGAIHADWMRDALDLLEGRRARQERETGVQKVTLNPKAAAAKAATVKTARPTPQVGTGTAPSTRPSSAAEPLDALKKRAANGDSKALGGLIDAFVA